MQNIQYMSRTLKLIKICKHIIYTERLAGVSFKDILRESLMIDKILGSQQQNGWDFSLGASSADFVSK